MFVHFVSEAEHIFGGKSSQYTWPMEPRPRKASCGAIVWGLSLCAKVVSKST